MFGDDLLVVPCLQPGGKVAFYLPKGQWLMFNQGRSFDGGQVHSLVLELEQMAVFVRAGKKIPLGQSIEHTGQVERIDKVVGYWPQDLRKD
jgi:alpha-D-xyloside xylohydrolase